MIEAYEKTYRNKKIYIDTKEWTVETPDYSKRNHHFYTGKY